MNTEPKRIPTAKSSIELYEAMARKYDLTAKQHSWLPPDVAFGLVFEYIKPRQKLLDVGCGTGLSSKYFSKVGVETYGIDGSKKYD